MHEVGDNHLSGWQLLILNRLRCPGACCKTADLLVLLGFLQFRESPFELCAWLLFAIYFCPYRVHQRHSGHVSGFSLLESHIVFARGSYKPTSCDLACFVGLLLFHISFAQSDFENCNHVTDACCALFRLARELNMPFPQSAVGP